MAPSRTLPSVIIHPLALNIDNRTSYFQETISPDGNLTVRGIPHFIRARTGAVSNANNNFNRIELYVRAWRGNTTSNTVSVVDMFGDLRSEVDEYGVRTRYSYDNFGNLSAKEIMAPCAITCMSTQHGGACNCNAEVLRFNVSNTDTNSVITGRSGANQGATNLQTSTQLNYDAFGNVASSSFRGSSEDQHNASTTSINYSPFRDKVTSVQNSVSSINRIRYNNRDLISSVTPTGWSTPSERTTNYGYGFTYDQNNDLTQVTLMNGENSHNTALVSKSIDRDSGTVTTSNHRGTATDTTTVNFDSYGRTSTVAENNSVSASFARQNEEARGGASNGISEVTQMVDHLENRSYHYSYDDNNNCTGYRRAFGGAIDFSVECIGENGDTVITYNSGISGRLRRSETRHQENILLSPRVRSTNDFVFIENNNRSFRRNVAYGYDSLGRIGSKTTSLLNNPTHHAIDTVNKYIPGTMLKDEVQVNARTGHLGAGRPMPSNYSFKYRYDGRGRIKSINNKVEYTYNNVNCLIKEESVLPNGIKRVDKSYTYNADGSIRSFIDTTNAHAGRQEFNYTYQNGRLVRIDSAKSNVNPQLASSTLTYDNLGNCTNDGNRDLTWERGSLLQRCGNLERYNYNNQGVRFEKRNPITNAVTHSYFHDGDKLVEEHLARGNTQIRYLYDAEGVMGFHVNGIDYYYVKDGEGSVIAIWQAVRMTSDTAWATDQMLIEVARYSYDTWGRTEIVSSDSIQLIANDTTSNIPIAELNPFRWKSQYQDHWTELYYMDGRYYSPEQMRFMSPVSYESMLGNSGVIYGLNPYLLTVDNPVNLAYNGHTIATNGELAWDMPDEFSRWQNFLFRAGRFFDTEEGRIFAIKMFVVAIALVVLTKGILAGLLFVGISRVSLTVGSVVAGRRARDSGGCFNEGFTDHINNNWAMSMAISSLLFMSMIGIGLAVGGIIGVVASKKGGAVSGVAGASKSGLPNAAKLAKKYTHNKRSKVVVLGKHDGGASTGYIAVAQKHKATYFSMPDELWNQLFTAHGESFMWSINEAFLTQQMAKGKIFMASHSMVNPTGAFAREILFLQNNTIAIIPI